MKFRVERDAFADAVAWTSRTLPARPAVPVLAGMRLDLPADGSRQLVLSSFDYEVSARAAVEADVEEPGSVLVSGRLLAEIARSLPDQPVDLSAEGSRVLLTCGSARFTLLTLPLEDYPGLPGMPEVMGTISSDAFATSVRQVAVGASRDDTLPMLTGVHMAFSGDSLTLAATDRYRIAVRDLWWHPEQPDLNATALVPARTLADTAKTLSSGTNVNIALSSVTARGAAESAGEGMIGFESGGWRTTTRLLDSDFIKYESRFPTEFAARAEVATGPLAEAVKRVALVADRNTPVLLSFSRGEVVLEAGSGDDAQALESIEAAFEGDDLRVAFSPQYLMDGLGAVDSDTARLGFVSPTKPVVISDVPANDTVQPHFRYLVMPLRVS